MNYKFEVMVSFHVGGNESIEKYSFIACDYPSFRTEFLKRFGNFSSTNKLNKQKKMVKDFSFIAENTKQFSGFVNVNTDFEVKVIWKGMTT